MIRSVDLLAAETLVSISPLLTQSLPTRQTARYYSTVPAVNDVQVRRDASRPTLRRRAAVTAEAWHIRRFRTIGETVLRVF
jgi:hypothetical protein